MKKYKKILVALVMLASVALPQLIFSGVASAQTVTCADGTEIPDPIATGNGPSGGANLTNEQRNQQRDAACSDSGGYNLFRVQCQGSGGEWVESSEVAGGKVIDSSSCRCPEGERSLDGFCVNPTASADAEMPSTGVVAEDDVITTDCETGPGEELSADNCAIIGFLVTGINVLSAVAGMVIVFSIMFAGFQYMTAQDNAGQIQQARTRIIWAITALLVFIFSYAILNFLVPGGVF